MIARTYKTLLLAFLALSVPSAFALTARSHNSAAPATYSPPAVQDLLFRPMPLCRVFNGGPIAANASHDYYVAGSGSQFAAQGGTSNGCGIPTSATAVAIALTAVNGTGAGGLIAYAQGGLRPSPGRIVSFQSNSLYTSSAIVPLSNNQITISAIAYTAQVAGDVTGYFVPQIEAYILGNGSVNSGTNRIIFVSRTGLGQYMITVDTNVNSCAVQAALPNQIGFVNASSIVGNAGNGGTLISVYTYSISGALADRDFSLSVHC